MLYKSLVGGCFFAGSFVHLCLQSSFKQMAAQEAGIVVQLKRLQQGKREAAAFLSLVEVDIVNFI